MMAYYTPPCYQRPRGTGRRRLTVIDRFMPLPKLQQVVFWSLTRPGAGDKTESADVFLEPTEANRVR